MLPISMIALLGISIAFLLTDSGTDEPETDENGDQDDAALPMMDIPLADVDTANALDDDTDLEPKTDPNTGAILVENHTSVQGTDGDDLFELAHSQPTWVGSQVTIEAGAGNDTLNMDEPDEGADGLYVLRNAVLDGGTGDDVIHAQTASSTILGGDGDDTIDGDLHSSTIDGGVGDDTIDADHAYSTVVGGDGDDVISSEGYLSTITAGAGNDFITSFDLESTITSGEGDDTLIAYGYENDIDMGTGDDLIRGSLSSSVITSGDGDDTFDLSVMDDSTLYGGAGEDTIRITREPQTTFNEIHGGAGNDVIDTGELSNTFVYGDSGDDMISIANVGQNSAMQAYGGDGDDHLALDVHSNDGDTAQLFGNAGTDTYQVDFLGYDVTTTQSAHVNLADFEPGVESVGISTELAGSNFVATSADLTEDSAAGNTRLTVTFEDGTNPDRVLYIDIAATGVTWGDVTFAGSNPPPVLTP